MEELSQFVDKICAEYFNGLLEKQKRKELKLKIYTSRQLWIL
jgi:hypothetical protein